MSSSQSLDQGQSVQQMVLGNWFCMHRSKNKTLTMHLKQNSKYIKDLLPDTIKLLKKTQKILL